MGRSLTPVYLKKLAGRAKGHIRKSNGGINHFSCTEAMQSSSDVFAVEDGAFTILIVKVGICEIGRRYILAAGLFIRHLQWVIGKRI